ncbi:hypothetical protein [uncultured Microscilla sp.]|uniref:tetratricopeptide repeat protein n=1 Tax=uncultured Microscilla sp. TaxID=432653 RepID=UPI0026046936|nr:hypothetical protein [uncultured Microscilla sp.]
MQKDIDSAKIVAFKSTTLASNNKEKRKASFLLGYIYGLNKEYNKSNKFYTSSIAISPLDKAWKLYVQANIAHNYLRLNQPVKAIALGQEVVKSQLNSKYSYNTYTVIGKAYAKRNKLDSAQYYLGKAYDKIMAVKNNKKLKANHFFTIAKTNEMFGRYNAAVLYYKKSQKLRNKNEDRCNVSLYMAQCYLKKGDLESANQYLNVADSNLYNQVLLLHAKGLLLFRQKKLPQLSLVCQKVNDLLDSNLREIIKEDHDLYLESRKALLHKKDLLQAELDQKAILAKQQLQTVATLRLAGFLSMVFLLIILFVVFKRYKNQTKKLAQLHLSSSENMDQNTAKIRSLKVIHTTQKDDTLEQGDDLTEDEKAKQVCDWILSNATFTLRRDT